MKHHTHSESESESADIPYKQILVSSYPVRKGLIRKAQLSYLLHKFVTKRSSSILTQTIPKTYIFEIDDVEYLDEALNDCYEVRDMNVGTDVFIMKPNVLNKGNALHILTDAQEQLPSIVTQYPDIKEWVIQEYIQRPLLIHDRKFHVRVYVLCVGNLSVYVHSDMLCLFATHPYSTDDYDNQQAHITNTCINENDPSFNEEKQVRLLSEILNVNDCHHITEQINDTVKGVFEALHSEPTYFMPLHNAFELYGFDFLIDESQSVYFLEANAQPDFSMTLNRLKYVIDDVIEQTFQLAVDRYFREAMGSSVNGMKHIFIDSTDRDGDRARKMIEVYTRQSNTRANIQYY